MKKALHVSLIKTACLHRQAARKQFQKLDLSEGQPKILSHLYQHDGILQKELSAQCNVSQATMTALLKKMIAQGLVEKRETHVSGGKHAYSIFLTQKGQLLAKKSIQIMDDLEEISYRGFSKKEKELLISLLERVCENLS